MAESTKKSKEEPSLIMLCNMLFLTIIFMSVVYPATVNLGTNQAALDNVTTCSANLLAMREAIEVYRIDHNGKLPTRLNDIVGTKKGYLTKLPQCPGATKLTYKQEGYKVNQGQPGRYTITCCGVFHGDFGYEKNQPYFDSLYGIRPTLKAF